MLVVHCHLKLSNVHTCFMVSIEFFVCNDRRDQEKNERKIGP